MITIVAELQAAPRKRGRAQERPHRNGWQGEGERAGRAGLLPARVDPEPGKFMFYEQYSSDEALASHGKTDHMGAMRRIRDGGLLAGRPDIQLYKHLAGVS